MNEPRWIGSEHAIVLHEIMLRRFGGHSGLRDPAGLDWALSRPREQFAAGTTSLPELAASYAAGLATRRPFHSGSLASAFVIATTFLRCNGLVFTGDKQMVVQWMTELGEGKETTDFARYVRCNTRAP